MPAQVKRVSVTTLTIDPNNIDWPILNERFSLYRYKAPQKQFKEKNYYAKIHNWYKTVCDLPCYFNTAEEQVYVLCLPTTDINPLRYENSEIKPQSVNVADPKMLHNLVKTLVSNYFFTYQRFVSNADFFLPVANLDSDFITVLKIRINQNWNNPNEFFFKDEAKFLRKLEDPQPNDFRANTSYYGISYDENSNPVFKQLKYNSIGLRQRKMGVYITYSSQKNRPQVTYHSVKSLEDLKESRSYVLNHFFSSLLGYFNHIGLPFQPKELDLQKIEAPSAQQMKRPQISLSDKTIYIVDDRMRPKVKPALEPDGFVDDFCAITQKVLWEMKQESKDELLDEQTPNFMAGDASKLPPGSYVLRIQDNEESDFKPKYKIDPITKEEVIDELALFKGFGDDPLPKFYQTYPKLVIQTLNVNDNTKIRNDQKKRKEKSALKKKWGIDEYLDYGQPDVTNKSFRHSLEVSLNQLILKDIVMHPQNAIALLPEEQLKIIKDKIFLFSESLMHFDGANLIFMPVSGNFNQAQKIIKDVANRDLIVDVLKPAMEWYNKYQFSKEDLEDEDKISETLKKGRFIITKDYVWQLIDSSERLLYPDQEIEARLENLEEKRPIRDFYPKFPVTGHEPFNEQQLQAYKKFLEESVEERYISYSELKDKYGYIKIKDEKGKMIKTGEGLYPVLSINSDTKLKDYFKDFLGLPIEKIRSQDVMSVYQGIWYEAQTRQYLVGSPESREIEQEKGFVLREILVHRGDTNQDKLFSALKTDFFPMLQVNFVRHKQYTVYPFPFNLIEIWKKIHTVELEPELLT